jgi:hypothetical protein
MSDLMQQAEALLGFSADLERRLGGDGLGGVSGLVERFEELRKALAQVGDDELAWARTQIHDLLATLSGVAEQLDQLHAIKRAIPQSP